MELEKQDWRMAAAAEYSERRAHLTKEKAAAAKAAEKAQAKLTVLDAEIEALDQGARVFGLPVFGAQEPATPKLAPSDDGGEPLFRDIILNILKGAYPAPMRVGALKEAAEADLGRSVHYKTPGMTLYRLTKEGSVRREGRDWFYVPTPAPKAAEVWRGLADAPADEEPDNRPSFSEEEEFF